jgi:hypothetical protein
MRAGWTALVAAWAAVASAADHPFILWTKDEAAAIRRRIETQDWAKAEYERMQAAPRGPGETFRRLFAYAVFGDEAAGSVERKYLLSFIGAPVGESRRHDEYLSALRYDVLYDSLTPEQRAGIEATFRRHVRHELDHPYRNNRLSLLPNMQLPRITGGHLMAAATGDADLVRAIWASASGFRWFFDEYLADGGLYFEEFGKMRSLVGEWLLFCRACDRLGLSSLGYGFRGKGGASMRSYVEGLMWIGWPRVELPGGLHHYGRVTMGDSKGSQCAGAPRFLLQHAIVPGAVEGDDPRGGEFYAANMNGRDHKGAKVEKLDPVHWFEVLHAKYPDAGFGYFLAEMRRRGQDRYYPTLLWGLGPIDPTGVRPPAAPSRVFPERGFAVLRAEEGPAYWEGPAPAIALQFATLYVHYLADCFSLLGFYAFNRPIYVNRTISAGYNGGPYDFSVRGHCGVVADGLQAQPVGPVPSRHDFAPLVKFVGVRTPALAEPYYTGREVRSSDQPKTPATEVYPGVHLERCLMLTREYLFDVYRVESGRERAYHWLVHAPGEPRPADPAAWKDSDDLQKTLFGVPEIRISGERRLDPGPHDWAVETVQACALEDVGQARLGRAWYERGVGVRVSMLGERGTLVYTFRPPQCYTPGSPRAPRQEDRPGYEAPAEVGGVSLAVARRAAGTTFVALHEPFEGGRPKPYAMAAIAREDEAVAVSVTGPGPVNDRLLLALGEGAARVRTLADGGEGFTFADHAFVRIGKDKVEAVGDLRGMKVRVEGTPRLVLNGRDAAARVSGGYMEYSK